MSALMGGRLDRELGVRHRLFARDLPLDCGVIHVIDLMHDLTAADLQPGGESSASRFAGLRSLHPPLDRDPLTAGDAPLNRPADRTKGSRKGAHIRLANHVPTNALEPVRRVLEEG